MSDIVPERSLKDLFDLTGRVVVVTGGGGMLSRRHASVVAELGGIPVLLDLDGAQSALHAREIGAEFGATTLGLQADVADRATLDLALARTLEAFGRVDVLINNASMTVKGASSRSAEYFAPFESYGLDMWNEALRTNVTGTFLCCQVFSRPMLAAKRGVILNIASDVGLISPDHRIYEGMKSRGDGRPFNTPLSYAVSKAALIHMTRYLATYWAPQGIRVNALSPAGVYDGQQEEFVRRLSSLIPLGRMARKDEYKGAVAFLISDASSFMTGSNVVVDGGRTAL